MFTAFMVAALVCVGVIGPQQTSVNCSSGDLNAYSSNAVKQDIRAISSFCFGALLCSLAMKPRVGVDGLKVSVQYLL